MATKKLSIDLAAYDRLVATRLGPDESFSQVICRAQWNREPKTCGCLLSALDGMPLAEEDVLESLELAQREDAPPCDVPVQK